jgi:7-cyano-7-deazaguanine reductase
MDTRHELLEIMVMTATRNIPGLTLLRQNQTDYPESPDQATLETFPNAYADRDYWVTFDCPEFTSRCPITNQPDFGHIRIRYVPGDRCIESKSLKLYLFAFRNHPTFHEEVVNRILDDIRGCCCPREIVVEGCFNPRGGISIRVDAQYRQGNTASAAASGKTDA